jgi:hypothetical protein
VDWNDWLLAFHVLSAFAFAGAIVVYWVLIYAARRTDSPEATVRMAPMVKVGDIVIGIGAVGTIIFGLWLAIALDAYHPWDGWVIGAIVLWAIAMGTGQRSGAAYQEGMKKAKELQAAGQTGPNAELLALNRTSSGLLFSALATIAVVLLLIDMIWKPGA